MAGLALLQGREASGSLLPALSCAGSDLGRDPQKLHPQSFPDLKGFVFVHFLFLLLLTLILEKALVWLIKEKKKNKTHKSRVTGSHLSCFDLHVGRTGSYFK